MKQYLDLVQHVLENGNEKADQLAKEGSMLDQENLNISNNEKRTIIKAMAMKKWKEEHPSFNPKDNILKLNRIDQVVLFRLRTGHNKMKAHMYNKLKIGETDRCPCNTGPMNIEHVLQHFQQRAEEGNMVSSCLSKYVCS